MPRYRAVHVGSPLECECVPNSTFSSSAPQTLDDAELQRLHEQWIREDEERLATEAAQAEASRAAYRKEYMVRVRSCGVNALVPRV